MKLMMSWNVFFGIASIFSVFVNAHGVERSVYIECELRLKERPSRKQQAGDFKLTNEKNSAYKSFTYPHIPVKQGTSQNWSGYVAGINLSKLKRHTVMAVYGSWIVPTLAESSQDTWCSLWVGIDGYGSDSVEQIGTEHDWHNGQQQDYAWFEMYPNYSYQIVGFPVGAGDVITASVEYEGDDIFLLSIANVTAGVHTTIPTSYTTAPNVRRSSAQWIVEAPYARGVLPLSHFNTVYFSNCAATISYMHGPINNKHWKNDMLTMVTAKEAAKAIPSALSAHGQDFSVAWQHE
jgi:hypothetical protein